jgi:hypothetical protein
VEELFITGSERWEGRSLSTIQKERKTRRKGNRAYLAQRDGRADLCRARNMKMKNED